MSVREQLTAAVNSRPRVTLYSHKMAALKPLLLAERLNTHALQLQLTAQSQLQRPQAPTKRRDDDDQNSSMPTARAKRARRERWSYLLNDHIRFLRLVLDMPKWFIGLFYSFCWGLCTNPDKLLCIYLRGIRIYSQDKQVFFNCCNLSMNGLRLISVM